jgi:uncharacterized membrane protein
MHNRIFQVGVGALLAVVGLMVTFELAASLGGADRAGGVAHLVESLGTLLLLVAVVSGFVLLPQAWRQYIHARRSMDKDRRHVWFLIMVFGLAIAGYLGYYYLRDEPQER